MQVSSPLLFQPFRAGTGTRQEIPNYTTQLLSWQQPWWQLLQWDTQEWSKLGLHWHQWISCQPLGAITSVLKKQLSTRFLHFRGKYECFFCLCKTWLLCMWLAARAFWVLSVRCYAVARVFSVNQKSLCSNLWYSSSVISNPYFNWSPWDFCKSDQL